MIVVTGLTKTYGKKSSAFTALDNVSLSIPGGATVAIIGKSGSGKSTLMHLMSGLDTPTSGTVEVGGEILSQLKSRQIDAFRARTMSFIFQSFFIEPNQTVLQNVMLPLEIAKMPRRSRKKRALEALTAVELDSKAGNKANDLSGGQKQRLAIARAIVNKPKLIFADEPTGNLDSVTGEKIIRLLFGLNKTLGSTLIVVTHDEELASKCQIKIILKDGKIISQEKQSVGTAKQRTVPVSRPQKTPPSQSGSIRKVKVI